MKLVHIGIQLDCISLSAQMYIGFLAQGNKVLKVLNYIIFLSEKLRKKNAKRIK